MSSVLVIQFAVLMLIALISVYAGGAIGGGLYAPVAIMASSLIAIMLCRSHDRIALKSRRLGGPALFSMALGDVVEVKHGERGIVDVLRLKGNRYVGLAAVEVYDVWESFQVAEPERLVAAIKSYGEAISSLGGVDVRIEIVKAPSSGEPLFRYLLIARSRHPEAAVSKAIKAAEQLADRLSALGMACRIATCKDGLCSVSALVMSNAVKQPISKSPFAALIAASVIPILTSLYLAPNVLALVSAISLPQLLAALFASWRVSSLSARRSVAVASRLLRAPIEYESGRLKIGGTYLSFASLKRIDHYDRVLGPEDILKLVSQLNRDLLYARYGYSIVIALRRIEEPLYQRKESLRMDMAQMDYETGGGRSRMLKAHKHEVHLERIRALGEHPFEVHSVMILKYQAEGLEQLAVVEDGFKACLEGLGLSVRWVRGPAGIARCIRLMYLPPDYGIPLLEPSDVSEVKALTYDFAWLAPNALDRSPLLAREGILLGLDQRSRRVYWNPRAIRNAHVAVLGPPGSGKSTLIRTMIIRAKRYYSERYGYEPLFVVIDPAGEYQGVVEELGGVVINMLDRKVNPLLLEGASPHERARFVAELLRYLKALKGEEVSALKEAILDSYKGVGIDPNEPSTWRLGRDSSVTLSMVYSRLSERLRASLGGAMEPVYRSLLDKLLDVAEGARAFNRTDLTVSELFSRGGVLCLSFKDEQGVMSDDLQRAVVWTLLQQIRDSLLSMRIEEELRVMIAIDEAHRFVRLGEIVEGGVRVAVEPPLSLHLRDTRKFGASYILITHMPDDMPRGVLELVGTVIAMSHPNNAYANWAKESLGLTEAQKQQLQSSGIGSGFMITTEDPRPLFVCFQPERSAMVRDARREMMQLVASSRAVRAARVEGSRPREARSLTQASIDKGRQERAQPGRQAISVAARAAGPGYGSVDEESLSHANHANVVRSVAASGSARAARVEAKGQPIQEREVISISSRATGQGYGSVDHVVNSMSSNSSRQVISEWLCSCGSVNRGRSCSLCGARRGDAR